MSRSLPQSNFIQGGYYHIYNRGIRKKKLFLEVSDYKRYLDRLREYLEKHQVSLLAYCLMPNHIHLLIRQNGPKPASALIQRLHTAYTMYFNKKYKLSGHPFQGRFKAKLISKDEYLRQLSRHIHLNPKRLVSKLPAYKWSSYPVYLGKSSELNLDTKFVLNMFKNKNQTLDDARRNYKDFIKSEAKILFIDKIAFKEDRH